MNYEDEITDIYNKLDPVLNQENKELGFVLIKQAYLKGRLRGAIEATPTWVRSNKNMREE